MLSIKRITTLLVIIAMAGVGMAGATEGFVVSAYNQETWDHLKAADAANNLNWGKIPPQILAAVMVDSDGNVIDHFFLKGKYDFGRPQYNGYPSVAGYAEWRSLDDRSAIIYDSQGNVIDTMSTPTQELDAILAAEYAANPMFIKGQPVFLYEPDTASGNGVPHGLLVHMSPELAVA